MCKELYQRWNGCDCWGFLRCDPCRRLFKGCLGPRGEQDKHVVEWNDGMCNECWERLLTEAREEAEAAKERDSRSNNAAAAAHHHHHARRSGKRGRVATAEAAEELAAASASSASGRSWSRSESASTPSSSGMGFWG